MKKVLFGSLRTLIKMTNLAIRIQNNFLKKAKINNRNSKEDKTISGRQ